MLKSKGRIAAAGTAVAVATSATAVLLLGGGSATAAEQRTAAAVAPANTVTGTSVVDGSLYQKDFNQDVINKVFRVPGMNAVTGWSVKDGSITEADLSKGVVAKLNAAGKPGVDGVNGVDGLSAYELAKKGGYDGTVTAWLASLKGTDGTNGTNGTNGTDGKDGAAGANGADGKSAYDIAKAGGYTGTEAEWLKSLIGISGADGKDGAPGADGKDGAPGKDGKDGAPGVAVSVNKTFEPTVITTIGGSYSTGATDIATLELPSAGTFLVNTRVTFDRKDKGSEGYLEPTTDTMPQLSLRYGTDGDAGTIMGSPISRAGFVELTGSSVAPVTVDGPTTITVRGFGYNEDRSGFGGGQITAAGQVTAVKIG